MAEIMATRAWTTAASVQIHSVALWEARTVSTQLLTWNQSAREWRPQDLEWLSLSPKMPGGDYFLFSVRFGGLID